jgi:hypothetical protein
MRRLDPERSTGVCTSVDPEARVADRESLEGVARAKLAGLSRDDAGTVENSHSNCEELRVCYGFPNSRVYNRQAERKELESFLSVTAVSEVAVLTISGNCLSHPLRNIEMKNSLILATVIAAAALAACGKKEEPKLLRPLPLPQLLPLRLLPLLPLTSAQEGMSGMSGMSGMLRLSGDLSGMSGMSAERMSGAEGYALAPRHVWHDRPPRALPTLPRLLQPTPPRLLLPVPSDCRLRCQEVIAPAIAS